MKTQEQIEYDARWSREDCYSADQIGYTPAFLNFMAQGFGSLPQKSQILEIGCGNGFFSEKIASLGHLLTAVDISEVGLSSAKAKCPAGKFVKHDLGQPLPFDANYFDGIWSSEVLEHLFSPLFVLQEAFRVLRPGGVLLATVPYHGLLKNLAIAAFAFDRHYDPTYPHIRFFTKRTLARITAVAGLAMEHITVCGSQLGVRDKLFPTNILLTARKLQQTA